MGHGERWYARCVAPAVRAYFLGLIISILAATAGCAASGQPSAAWVARAGGLLADTHQQRAEAAVARLTTGDPQLRVKVHVLATDAVCAFAWPNRTIYVTRGLMDRADDDVLAAALAHEMGHLLSDGRARSIASLKGCDKNADAEVQADAYGMGLLRANHVPANSMARMLRLVCDSNSLAPGCRRAINDRIELLLTAPATVPQN